MERKIMRKRKGKWITVSTSLVASLSILSSSSHLILAQESVDDQSVSNDSQWQADAPEVSWQDVPDQATVETTITEETVANEAIALEAEGESVDYTAEVTPVESVVEAATVETVAEVIPTEEIIANPATEEVPVEELAAENESVQQVEEVFKETPSDDVSTELTGEEVVEAEVALTDSSETAEVVNEEEVVAEEIPTETVDEVTPTEEVAIEETAVENELVQEDAEELIAETLTEDTSTEWVEEVEETPALDTVEDLPTEEVVTPAEEVPTDWVIEEIPTETPTEEAIEAVVEEAPLAEPIESTSEASLEDVIAEETPTETVTEDTSVEEVTEAPVEEEVAQNSQELITETPIEDTSVEAVAEEAATEEAATETPVTEDVSEENLAEESEQTEVEVPAEESSEDVVLEEEESSETTDEVAEETVESTTEESELVSSDEEAEVIELEESANEEMNSDESIESENSESEAETAETNSETVPADDTDQAVEENQEDTEESLATRRITPTAEVTANSHNVVRGDTLWSIAQRNQTTVENLRKWNNLSNNTIQVNRSLYVSDPTSTTQSNDRRRQSEVRNYKINQGDTLYSIARRNNVSVNDLKEWNQLTNDIIYSNQSLVVSNPNAANDQSENQSEAQESNSNETKNTSYTVKSGDTLYSIARRNNVSVAQLREWNNISGSIIYTNRNLVVSSPNSTENNNQKPTEEESNLETATPETNETTHNVRRGEYLYSIANQYGVTVNDLREWNNLSNDVLLTNTQLIVSNPNSGQATDGEDQVAETPEQEQSPDASEVSDRSQLVVEWFQEKEGKTTYSMANRNGPKSYDCSSAVFSALIHAGYLNEGTWLGTTETLFSYEGSLLTPITRDEVQAGDIFVSGYKGSSLGSAGHTGVAVSNSQIIHSNYRDNGISTTAIEGRTASYNNPTYWYRLNDAFNAN